MHARTHAHTQVKCTTFVGTFLYMSPERFGSEPYSFPSGGCIYICVYMYEYTRTHARTHTHTHTITTFM